jgi:hypothetical protein
MRAVSNSHDSIARTVRVWQPIARRHHDSLSIRNSRRLPSIDPLDKIVDAKGNPIGSLSSSDLVA